MEAKLFHDIAQRALPLLDLTSLNSEDNEASIIKLCEKAKNAPILPAAVCVYPQFVWLVKKTLKDCAIKIATVVNFPHGDADIDSVTQAITKAISHGADEIDVVFAYPLFFAGKIDEVIAFMHAVRCACQDKTLKVILETGAYADSAQLKHACEISLQSGADFLKTSTGKIPQGATLASAEILLEAIQANSKPAGLKISGGIRTIDQVKDYFELTDRMMGGAWINPNTFRIGASSLYDELVLKNSFSF